MLAVIDDISSLYVFECFQYLEDAPLMRTLKSLFRMPIKSFRSISFGRMRLTLKIISLKLKIEQGCFPISVVKRMRWWSLRPFFSR